MKCKGKKFFFEKKNQKTFVSLSYGRFLSHRPKDQKFFARFFSKKRFFLLFALVMISLMPIPTRAQPAPVPPLTQAENAFAIDLYGQLCKIQGNFFFSPYSIATALGMVYAGSKSGTADQLARVLHLDLLQPAAGTDLQAAFLQAVKQQPAIGYGDLDETKFESANALWGAARYPFNAAYIATLKTVFGGDLTSLDFANAAASAQEINSWVAGKTNNKIQNLVPASTLNAQTRLVLTNAVYFKAAWEESFDTAGTAPAPFHLAPGQTIQVPTMHLEKYLVYATGDHVKLLTLDYARGAASMVIILPDDPNGLPALEAGLTEAKLEGWLAGGSGQRVALALPKFKADSDFDLNIPLQALGIVDAFDPVKANLTGIADVPGDPLYISDAIHKTYIDVDENGTEAAAATAIMVQTAMAAPGPPPPPIPFIVDHPFIYLIRANPTGQILFMGRVANPAG